MSRAQFKIVGSLVLLVGASAFLCWVYRNTWPLIVVIPVLLFSLLFLWNVLQVQRRRRKKTREEINMGEHVS
jgi:membrane protein YdbS with pleckstrin-like domain